MRPQLIGAYGEYIAAKLLREKGYSVITTNFRINSGEIDIVAEKNNIISFVEVKTRKDGGIYAPADAVDYKKQENLKTAASIYLSRFKLKNEYQFDIIEVLLNEEQKVFSVNHIEKAF